MEVNVMRAVQVQLLSTDPLIRPLLTFLAVKFLEHSRQLSAVAKSNLILKDVRQVASYLKERSDYSGPQSPQTEHARLVIFCERVENLFASFLYWTRILTCLLRNLPGAWVEIAQTCVSESRYGIILE
jgi:hypothetical protein